jgi:hypothetical protein
VAGLQATFTRPYPGNVVPATAIGVVVVVVFVVVSGTLAGIVM